MVNGVCITKGYSDHLCVLGAKGQGDIYLELSYDSLRELLIHFLADDVHT